VHAGKGWGWITLIIGILEVLASLSLFAGGEYGRWFAIIVGALAALAALLSIPAYPLWSMKIFAPSLWIIYGLVIYGVPEPTQAAGPSQGAPPPRTAPGSPPRTASTTGGATAERERARASDPCPEGSVTSNGNTCLVRDRKERCAR